MRGHHSLVCRKASELEQDLGSRVREATAPYMGGEKVTRECREGPAGQRGPESPCMAIGKPLNPAGPSFLVHKGKGQRHCSPRFLSSVGFCDSMTASSF